MQQATAENFEDWGAPILLPALLLRVILSNLGSGRNLPSKPDWHMLQNCSIVWIMVLFLRFSKQILTNYSSTGSAKASSPFTYDNLGEMGGMFLVSCLVTVCHCLHFRESFSGVACELDSVAQVLSAQVSHHGSAGLYR